jgi:plasmid replication initiation protein
LFDRTVETILAEWRAAEAERELRPGDIELDQHIARLRDEYNAAVDARQSDADDLGRRPGEELASA